MREPDCYLLVWRDGYYGLAYQRDVDALAHNKRDMFGFWRVKMKRWCDILAWAMEGAA